MVKWCPFIFEAAFVFVVVLLEGLRLVHSHPDIYHVRPKDGSRAIQPYSCHDPTTKQEGVCMFSWNCQRSNGTHLTYCMDRFYFGSCCRLPPGVYIATPPSVASNEVTDVQKVKHRPSTQRPTTESTSEYWSTDDLEEKRFPTSTRRPSKPRPRPTKVTATEFPPGLVTWRPNSETSTTYIPNKKKPTKLFSTKPLYASPTTENKTTESPYKSTSERTHTYTHETSYKYTSERPNTESSRKPTSEKPYMPSIIRSTIKTNATTPDQYSSTSMSTVSRRRTRPTRPYGSTNPKRRTRPTKPYSTRNSTASQDIRKKTKPARPTVYNKPTTPIPIYVTEQSTTVSNIGTWSNILERTTRPLPFPRRTPPTAPTRVTLKTTVLPVTSNTKRPALPVSNTTQRPPSSVTSTTHRPAPTVSRTTQRPAPTVSRTTQRPAPTVSRTTQRPAPTVSRTTQRPVTQVTNTTPRTTVEHSTTRRRTRPTRPRPTTTPTYPSTTRRSPTTTRVSNIVRTSETPSTEIEIEIVTFPPFPGVTRTTTQRPMSTTRVTDVRRTTTSRPRTTTVTVLLPSSTERTTETLTTKPTTETPTTTEKITPGQDYTKDNTVAQTSASGDLLSTTHPSEGLASSTLNPDIELTTEQDEGTTVEWFTMTSSTKHNTIGRNPIPSNRPVQVLYDENGHEILKQEEVEVKAASKLKQGGSSTVAMTSKVSEKHHTTVAGVSPASAISKVTSGATLEGVNATEIIEIINALKDNASEEPATFSSEDGSRTNVPSLKKKYTGKLSTATPSMAKSTLELRHASTTTESLESSKFLTSTTESMLPTTKISNLKVKTTLGTFLTKTPAITTITTKDIDRTISSTLEFPFYTSQAEKSTLVTEDQSTHLENGNQISENITDVHPKTPTEATIHGEHLLEDYLYENYDYYDDDLYGENYPQPEASSTTKNSEKFQETVNNHKVTFSSLGTFAALSQKSTPPSHTVKHSNQPLHNKHSQSPTHSISQKNKFKPTIPTFSQQGNFISKPTPTSAIKPLQKPFLPNILHETPQVGKLPVHAIKKPSSATVPHEITNIDIRTTTQIPIVDKPQLSTFYPLTDITKESEKVTIVTVDNHRPLTAPLDEPKYTKPIYNPLITSSSESDNTYENTIDNSDSTIEIDKIPAVEVKPTSSFTFLSEDKTTHGASNDISENTISVNTVSAEETKFTTLVNNHGVKYPFPTVLTPHTTKDSVETASSIDSLSTENTEKVPQETKFTTLTNNHGVKYPFPTLIVEQTTKDTLVTESSDIKSTFANTAIGQDSTSETTSKWPISDNSITTNIEFKPTNTFDYIPIRTKTTPSDLNSGETESQTFSISTYSDNQTPTSEVLSTIYDTNYTPGDTNTANYNHTTTEDNISTTISLDFTDSTPLTTNTPLPISTSTETDLASADYKQVCGKPRPGPVGRVVGGGNSYFGEWPWVVSLRQWKKNAFLHKCGATLLNEFWAITAAHCVENVPLTDILLRLGEYDISHENEPFPFVERRVQIVASHPQFDRRTFEYDLALLRFYEPVTFQRNIIPVCIPGGNDTYVGKYATVTGWGRLYEDGPLPDVIQEVSLPIITNKLCENMYRQAGFVEDIPEIFICSGYSSGGKDSCEGDSGGPMVLQEEDGRWVLAGVISWGIGCALPNQPGVYTRITKFSEWINQIIIF